MAEGVGHHSPGILGLAHVADEHESALSADLIRAGLRLRDAGCSPAFTLADLRDFVQYSPPDSALYQSMYPPTEESAWTPDMHLLAVIADSLRWLQWAKTKDASKGRNPPKPIPRPGIEPDEKKTTGTAIPLDQARDRYKVARLPEHT